MVLSFVGRTRKVIRRLQPLSKQRRSDLGPFFSSFATSRNLERLPAPSLPSLAPLSSPQRNPSRLPSSYHLQQSKRCPTRTLPPQLPLSRLRRLALLSPSPTGRFIVLITTSLTTLKTILPLPPLDPRRQLGLRLNQDPCQRFLDEPHRRPRLREQESSPLPTRLDWFFPVEEPGKRVLDRLLLVVELQQR